MRERTVPGALLIAIGLFLLVVQQFDFGGEVVVALIGAAFLVAYALTRQYALLVPGGIMTGLGIGVIVEVRGPGGGSAAVLGLGLGFVAIYVIDRLIRNEAWEGNWWPLIPGSILTLIGLSLLSQTRWVWAFIGKWWPLALVLIGLWILTRPARAGRTEKSPPPGAP